MADERWNNLSPRKLKLLTGIIEAYIRTGEPVGSKTLAEQFDHALSSATIRNEMAELASMGLLEQPHTSAGRIPTAAAFRLYIDKLMRREPIAEQNRQQIDERLERAVTPTELLEDASETLADVTGLAAVSTTPSDQQVRIQRIECMRVTSRTIALVMMTSTGQIRNRLCRFEKEVSADHLTQMNRMLSESFVGEPLSAITLPRVQGMISALPEDGLFWMPLLTSFLELVQQASKGDILLSGQLNLLQHPDYELERARLLLNFLSQRDVLSAMLTANTGGLQVVIGNELAMPELDGSSVIITRYQIPSKQQDGAASGPMGGLGLIGPMRMNYATAITHMEYIAKTLSRLLSEFLNDG